MTQQHRYLERNAGSAEQALRASEERLRTLFQHSQSGLMVIQGPVGAPPFMVNRSLCQMLGYSQQELLGLPGIDLVHPEDREGARKRGEVLRRGGAIEPWRLRLLHRDGDVVYAEASGTPFALDGKRPAILIELRDVTALVDADRALRASEQRYRTLVESSARGIALVQLPHGTIVYGNEALASIVGCRRADLPGQSWPELLAPEQRDEARRGLAGTEASRRRYRLLRFDGEVREVEASLVPLDGESGEEGGARLLELEDVTDRLVLQSEVSSTRVQLRQAQKSEALATLVAGVAHDFNNLLTAIAGSLDLVRRDPAGSERWVGNALRATERAGELVGQILQFSRSDVPVRRPVALPALVDETVGMARETFDRRIGIEVRRAPADFPQVMADEGQVQQVLLNLLLNARDAVEERMRTSEESFRYQPRITVRVAPGSLPPPEQGAEPRRAASVVVEDNGPGMSNEVRERIFDPFFSTKQPGQGTGLGLATALGIIVDHGGALDVQSVVGRGSTFTVTLPVSPGPGQEAVDGADEAGTGDGQEARSGRCVLVVDDEPLIREIAEQTLSDAGFEVLCAGGGAEAMHLAASRRLDVAVVDVNMPAPNGWETLQHLLQQSPSLRVLMASGYASEEDAMARGATGFLAKPYTPRTLLAAVDQLLAK